MNLFLNNPPRWIARALQIVSGGTPPAITPELYQTAETIQGGWGLAQWNTVTIPGQVGATTTFGLNSDPTTFGTLREDVTLLVQAAITNPGTATVTTTFGLYRGIPGLTPEVRIWNTGVPAGTLYSWNGQIAAGLQYWVIPPGFSLLIVQNAYTTSAGRVDLLVGTLPAGVNPL